MRVWRRMGRHGKALDLSEHIFRLVSSRVALSIFGDNSRKLCYSRRLGLHGKRQIGRHWAPVNHGPFLSLLPSAWRREERSIWRERGCLIGFGSRGAQR